MQLLLVGSKLGLLSYVVNVCGFEQDYCDAELDIHRSKLQFAHSLLCYEQLDPCFQFLACSCSQVNINGDRLSLPFNSHKKNSWCLSTF